VCSQPALFRIAQEKHTFSASYGIVLNSIGWVGFNHLLLVMESSYVRLNSSRSLMASARQQLSCHSTQAGNTWKIENPHPHPRGTVPIECQTRCRHSSRHKQGVAAPLASAVLMLHVGHCNMMRLGQQRQVAPQPLGLSGDAPDIE
jgi:hypothetical protein